MARLPKLITNHTGVALIEAVIALAVLGIMISAVAPLFFAGQHYTIDTERSLDARLAARSNLDIARTLIMDADKFSDITAGTYGISYTQFAGTLTSSPTVINDMTHTIIIEDVSADVKRIRSQIDWQTNVPEHIELVATVSNWKEYVDD